MHDAKVDGLAPTNRDRGRYATLSGFVVLIRRWFPAYTSYLTVLAGLSSLNRMKSKARIPAGRGSYRRTVHVVQPLRLVC